MVHIVVTISISAGKVTKSFAIPKEIVENKSLKSFSPCKIRMNDGVGVNESHSNTTANVHYLNSFNSVTDLEKVELFLFPVVYRQP